MSDNDLLMLAIAGAAVYYFGFMRRNGPANVGAISPTIKETTREVDVQAPLPRGLERNTYTRGGNKVYIGEGGVA